MATLPSESKAQTLPSNLTKIGLDDSVSSSVNALSPKVPTTLQSKSAFSSKKTKESFGNVSESTVVPDLTKIESPKTRASSIRNSMKQSVSETDGSIFKHKKALSNISDVSSVPVAEPILPRKFSQSFAEEVKVTEVSPPELMPENLKLKFESSLLKLEERPIEYYESLLYDLTRFYAIELGGELPKVESVEMYHPLKKLQERTVEMGEEDRAVLVEATEDLIDNHTFAQLDYKHLAMVMDFISGLLVKWKLIRSYEYSYRYREAVFSSKLIDINAINNGLISMEVLYFATIANKHPLQSMLHQTVKQYAALVLNNSLSLLECMLLLTDADFNKVRSISGYLAACNNELSVKYGFIPDFVEAKPSYHRLSLKTGCLAMCTSSSKERMNLALKERLIEFEMAYRYFETVLIKDLAHLKSAA